MADEKKQLNRFPLEGVEVWRNPKNKFVVFQLHYTANPRKTDPNYRESVKSGMPIAQYLQEYELQWESFAGKPVYQDFQERIHGSKDAILPELGLPLLRGWDFGLTPACVIAQLVEGQLRILREFTAINMGIERFAATVIPELRTLYPNWRDQKKDWIDFIDPAGFQRKDTDETTCAQILVGQGLAPRPGPVAFEARRKAVEGLLTGITKKGPNFIIDLAECPVLVRGFRGGYRYPEKSFEIEPSKWRPIKDEHSHPHDALQYIAAGVKTLARTKTLNVPTPTYSRRVLGGGPERRPG